MMTNQFPIVSQFLHSFRTTSAEALPGSTYVTLTIDAEFGWGISCVIFDDHDSLSQCLKEPSRQSPVIQLLRGWDVLVYAERKRLCRDSSSICAALSGSYSCLPGATCFSRRS